MSSGLWSQADWELRTAALFEYGGGSLFDGQDDGLGGSSLFEEGSTHWQLLWDLLGPQEILVLADQDSVLAEALLDAFVQNIPEASQPDTAPQEDTPPPPADAPQDTTQDTTEDASSSTLTIPDPAPEPDPEPQTTPEPTPPPPPVYNPGDFTGAGQAVVIIDTGYSSLYDQSQLVYAHDFVGSGADTADLMSHGAWVGQVVTDTAGGADIIHLKVFPDGGGVAPLPAIETALQWVVDHGADYNVAAVNLALGYGSATTETTSVLSDEMAALADQGIFTVVAAGNSGLDGRINGLAADPNAIAVSSVDDTGAFSAFASRSASLTDITGLGEGIVVEALDGTALKLQGSSFSAAYVSGAAAVLQDAAHEALGRGLTETEFLDLLQHTGGPVTGYETNTPDGYHVADVDAALGYFLDHLDLYGSGADSFAFG